MDGHKESMKRPTASWEYTFVPANQAETRAVSIFGKMGKPGEVLLHMTGNTTVVAKAKRSINGQKMVDIKARFIIDGQTNDDLEVLRDKVQLLHFDDCSLHMEQLEINLIAVITIVVITLLGIMSLAGLCVYKYRRNNTEDEETLVSNMVQQSPARPYHLTSPQDRGEFHRRMPSIHMDMVHYVVPPKNKEASDVTNQPKKKSKSNEDLKLYVSTAMDSKGSSANPTIARRFQICRIPPMQVMTRLTTRSCLHHLCRGNHKFKILCLPIIPTHQVENHSSSIVNRPPKSRQRFARLRRQT